MQAEAAYREALRTSPEDAHAHVGLGNALQLQQRYREAEAALRQAVRINPTDAYAHVCLGDTLQREGRYSEAEAEFREAIRLKPTISDGYTYLGDALQGQERYSEAEAAFREALRLKPADSYTYTCLGNTFDKQQRYAEAEAAFREAIHFKPEDSHSHACLGLIFDKQERYSEAEAAFREALRLKPADSFVHTCLADVLDKQAQCSEAETALREAIQLDPTNTYAYMRLGYTFYMQQRYAEAEAVFREVIHLDPTDSFVHKCLADVLDKQAQCSEAETALREAVRLDSLSSRHNAHKNLKLGRQRKAHLRASGDYQQSPRGTTISKRPDASTVLEVMLTLPVILGSVGVMSLIGRLVWPDQAWVVPVAWGVGGLALLIPFVENGLGGVLFNIRRPSPAESAKLQPLWERVCRKAGVDSNEYKLCIARSTRWSAFAAGGRVVAVNRRGLARRPQDLEAILAHELGHHLAGHPRIGLLRWWYELPARRCFRVVRRLAKALPGSHGVELLIGTVLTLGLLIGLAFLNPWLLAAPALSPVMAWLQRRAEYQADRIAADLGYGNTLIDRFERQARRRGDTRSWRARVFASHPSYIDRVSRLRRHAGHH